jgi:hypothetical protein
MLHNNKDIKLVLDGVCIDDSIGHF